MNGTKFYSPLFLWALLNLKIKVSVCMLPKISLGALLCSIFSCQKLVPVLRFLPMGAVRGELIWDPVKIWIIRAGCSEECCQQFTWRGGAQFEVTGMYSRWLTAAILGTGKAFLVFGSTAIRKPVAEPLNSQTPIFHAEQVKSELCTSFWKS